MITSPDHTRRHKSFNAAAIDYYFSLLVGYFVRR